MVTSVEFGSLLGSGVDIAGAGFELVFLGIALAKMRECLDTFKSDERIRFVAFFKLV